MNQNKDILHLFREIQVKYSRIYASILCQSDLTLPQFALLSHLVFQGSKSMTVASKELHVTKPAITYLADLLEEKKILRRVPIPGDRRIHNLEVTSKGEAAVEKIQKLVLSFLFKSLEKFDSKAKKVIVAFYEELAGRVNIFLEKGKS